MTRQATAKRKDSAANAKRIQVLATQGIDLLRTEREAILSGQFEKLESIRVEKNTLMEEIEQRLSILELARATPDAKLERERLGSTISLLSRRAKQNLKLLEGARAGAQNAQAQLVQATGSVPTEIGLYSPEGARIQTHQGPSTNSIKM